ncbi:MAG: hypothetical protein LBN06_04410 [Prevotellaceae bacterium]|jgi:hypothetical protein|nr:hypothetical protein [Prevotellaceae bacterium]
MRAKVKYVIDVLADYKCNILAIITPISLLIFGVLWLVSGRLYGWLMAIPSLTIILFDVALCFCLDNQKSRRWTIRIVNRAIAERFSVFGVFLTIAGIFISSSWEILSQQKETMMPIRALYGNLNNNYTWEDIATENSGGNLDDCNFIFIVDQSGSVETQKVDEKDIKYWQKKVMETRWVDGEEYPIKKRDGHYRYSSIIKARLKRLLFELNALNEKGTIKGKYSIISFSGNSHKKFPTEIPIGINELKQTFDTVDTYEFKGKDTNFIDLLEHIQEKYCNQSNENAKIAKYTFVFLSDYIHDFPNDKNNDNDRHRIVSLLKDLRQHSLFLNFYIDNQKEVSLSDTTSTVRISKLFDKIEGLDYQTIALNDSSLFIDKIALSKPLLFHHASYLFDSIRINIKFNEEYSDRDLSVRLKYNTNGDKRQTFYILQQGNHIPQRLYSDGDEFLSKIRKGDTLSIIMKGHIPTRYPFTELVITDSKKHLQYSFEIVLLKFLPQFYYWVIPIFFMLLGWYIALLCAPIKKATKTNKKTSDENGTNPNNANDDTTDKVNPR